MLKFVKSKIHPENERSLEKMGKTLTKERENAIQEIRKSNFNISNLGLITIKLFFGNNLNGFWEFFFIMAPFVCGCWFTKHTDLHKIPRLKIFRNPTVGNQGL